MWDPLGFTLLMRSLGPVQGVPPGFASWKIQVKGSKIRVIRFSDRVLRVVLGLGFGILEKSTALSVACLSQWVLRFTIRALIIRIRLRDMVQFSYNEEP